MSYETSFLQLRGVMNKMISTVNRNHCLEEVILQLFLSCMLFFTSPYLIASKSLIHVESGNIYYGSDNESIQLTNTGNDGFPALSPNKKSIVFLRRSGPAIPQECLTDNAETHSWQIWLYDLVSKKEDLLVAANFNCENIEEMIVFPEVGSLTFSPDSKSLYFLTNAWATSSKLHVVDIASKKQHFLMQANSIKVVNHGKYKGYLIVQQHRYFLNSGSYDWYWLFSPEGKEIGPLGEEESAYSGGD